MPEFPAATDAPPNATGTAAPRRAGIARAVGRASGPGTRVRVLGAIAVPGDESGLRHVTVACREPGCRSVWRDPAHEPG